ncbi:flagellar assembly peptidoglycan hydrolase FlgJ [Aquitalea sp. S1-19]|nr:flagellar assembly peptidoglycan hydrolase FlgJ [Aquitalea sp. S1-19]
MSVVSSLNPATDLSRQLALDPSGASRLADIARKSPEEGIRQVAHQFESMLMETMVRSMRATDLGGEEDSSDMQTWRGMLDQQMVQAMVGSGGIGMGDMLAREIGKLSQVDMPAREVQRLASPASTLPSALLQSLERARLAVKTVAEPAAMSADSQVAIPREARAFVETLLPHAQKAAAQLGVDAHLIVSHAALESGWGKRAIRHPDGRESYNLFGIKAGGSWQGDSVATLTTEFVGGKAQKQVESFRAYGSLQEAFNDYARLIQSSPRYQGALGSGGDAAAYGKALQQGGYATDPSYAQKLLAVARSAKQG